MAIIDNKDFYTLRGYSSLESPEISSAMEDYLEMICRLSLGGVAVRVSDLAAKLHVTPPSASKMILRLKERGLIDFKPYGVLRLTEKGNELGAYLLMRHDVLHSFFSRLNKNGDQLALVEKIEHFIDAQTVENIRKLLNEHDF